MIPHFDLPFRFLPGGGPAAVVEQDTVDEIANCVQAVVRTEIGTRMYVPRFGIEDPTFEKQPVNLDVITSQIALNEPRARTALSQYPSQFDELIANIVLEVSNHGQ